MLSIAQVLSLIWCSNPAGKQQHSIQRVLFLKIVKQKQKSTRYKPRITGVTDTKCGLQVLHDMNDEWLTSVNE